MPTGPDYLPVRVADVEDDADAEGGGGSGGGGSKSMLPSSLSSLSTAAAAAMAADDVDEEDDEEEDDVGAFPSSFQSDKDKGKGKGRRKSKMPLPGASSSSSSSSSSSLSRALMALLSLTLHSVRNVLFPRSYNARRRMGYVAMAGGATLLLLFAALVLGPGTTKGRAQSQSHSHSHSPPDGGGSTWGYEGHITPNPDASTLALRADGMRSMARSARTLAVSTWNIAAVNNNPFEYWITYRDGDGSYDALMSSIERFVEHPEHFGGGGAGDLFVRDVFSDDMFDELERRMDAVGWDAAHGVRKLWEADYRSRKIVSGFLKDEQLGAKRLASMPDRVTNTIHVDGPAKGKEGGENNQDPELACRPSVISPYTGDLSSVSAWWDAWLAFMFDTYLTVDKKQSYVYAMLLPISKTKYPAITVEEEALSLPLQTLCAAIFDAILVHMMNTVSDSPAKWQELKKTMVTNLIREKIPRTLAILSDQYRSSDIITLQETSASFLAKARSDTSTSDPSLSDAYHVVIPASMDAVRDQNSAILLKRSTFPSGALSEITSLVETNLPPDSESLIAGGDLLVITTRDVDNVPYVVASFHGDTDGLATKPVLDALVRTMAFDSSLVSHALIFGLDANTYERGVPGRKQGVLDFGERYVQHGLTSAWGDVPQPSNYTTFNARTYLQPQLNKACRYDERRSKGDVNPKDFVLFRNDDFYVVKTRKDNTGKGADGDADEEGGSGAYVEDMPFPTLTFPSDHGILTTVLKPKPKWG